MIVCSSIACKIQPFASGSFTLLHCCALEQRRLTCVGSMQVEDISCAVDFLSGQELVDPNQIAVFGICAGGSYVLETAAADRRIKAAGSHTSHVNISLLWCK